MLGDILIIVFVLLIFLVAVVLIRTLSYAKEAELVTLMDLPEVDAEVVGSHLGAAIRCQTISSSDPTQVDPKTFLDLHAVLEKLYPRLHATLKKELIQQLGLLYTWQGKQPGLEPVLFMAHQDVVPIDPATLPDWKYLPFSGEMAEGFVWGRGSMDIKCQMITVLEAVEHLLREGFQPERTIYLAFGQDEEVGGYQGSAQIVDLLQDRGVHLAGVIDEGGSVSDEIIPGISTLAALIGTAEKGHLNIEVKAEGEPGHSSTPSHQTAIGILAQAITRIEANPMPAHLEQITPLFKGIGATLPFGMQLRLANLWLFKGALQRKLEADPWGNAAMRTTLAATIVSGGVKDNLLPRQAKVIINSRVLPGDKVDEIVNHVREAVHDERVKVSLTGGSGRGASPVSPTDTNAYASLSMVIRSVFPGVYVAPTLVLGATDARHYCAICENVYRFSPYKTGEDSKGRVHGTNERIEVESLGKMVQFFVSIIKVWSQPTMI
jgi:carboxypeptidase PM20D1